MSVTYVYYLQSTQSVMEGLTSVSPSHNTVTFLLLCTTPAFSAAEHMQCFSTSIHTKNSCKTIPCVHVAYLVDSTFLELSAIPRPTGLEPPWAGSKPPQTQLYFHPLPLDMGILSRNLSQTTPLLIRNYSKAYCNHKGLQQPTYQIC